MEVGGGVSEEEKVDHCIFHDETMELLATGQTTLTVIIKGTAKVCASLGTV